ncbi:hypothetical protein NDU88_000435, partial [Pleurodeles waltl]
GQCELPSKTWNKSATAGPVTASFLQRHGACVALLGQCELPSKPWNKCGTAGPVQASLTSANVLQCHI